MLESRKLTDKKHDDGRIAGWAWKGKQGNIVWGMQPLPPLTSLGDGPGSFVLLPTARVVCPVMSLHVCLARALPQCATCFKLRDGPLSSNTGAEILRYGSAWRDDGDGTASTVCLHRLPLLKLFSKLSIDSPLTHLMPPDQVTEHSYDMQDDAADQGLSDSGTKPVTPSAQVVAKNALVHQAQVFFF